MVGEKRGSLTGARDRIDTRSEVFDDRTSSTFDGEDTGQFQDHVFGRCPPAEFAG